jgi:hypothetical protein
MVNVDEIEQLVEHHFDHTGRISVDPTTGVVSCTGNMNLKSKIKVDQLPVQFDQVGGQFNCEHNNLTTLIGSPTQTGLYFSCVYNPLVSLEGLPDHVGALCWVTWRAQLPLLRLLKLEHLSLKDAPDPVLDIIYKHLGQGKPGAIKAAAKLIKAGYKANARW